MSEQEQLNYDRVAKAISFIRDNFQEQPGLERIAEHVHLSPFHFQRLFSAWAGTTPKKFLQYTTIEHAKSLLKEEGATLSATAFDTGLSGTGRLHDLFINIEGMTPAEYKNGGKALLIRYDLVESPFGKIIVASTAKGICHLPFHNDEALALEGLRARFPEATFQRGSDALQRNALRIFHADRSHMERIKLHLHGSDFQLKVWEALLHIPQGRLITYRSLATRTGDATATRAVGAAMASNPVAFLIPCHRVIGSTGKLGGYAWGETRKTAMIAWESCRANRYPIEQETGVRRA